MRVLEAPNLNLKQCIPQAAASKRELAGGVGAAGQGPWSVEVERVVG